MEGGEINLTFGDEKLLGVFALGNFTLYRFRCCSFTLFIVADVDS